MSHARAHRFLVIAVRSSSGAALALGALFAATACGPRDPATFEVTRGADAGKLEPLAEASPGPEDWPWWRGPGRDGKSRETDPPLEWREEAGVAWRTPVPGRGHGSPSVWGDRIYLATADEEKEEQLVLAYDRASGSELWRRVVHQGGFVHRHTKNSHASGTPACDGERVYIAFLNAGAIRATALDRDGRIVWQRKAGDFETEHGYGASPVLYGQTVIVCGDSNGSSFLTALHRGTGDVVWTTERRAVSSFASPIVGRVAGRDQLLLSGADVVASYAPSSGELLWHCEGPTETMASTMAFGGDLVVATGGYPEKEILCIRADGEGDVSDSRVVWREKRGVSYVPSPLIHEGRLYIVNDQGIATCFGLASGKELWKGRLEGGFSASPVLAGGRIYVTSEAGETFVIEAGDEFRILARNKLPGGGFATPVIAGGRIYLRTTEALWAIGGG